VIEDDITLQAWALKALGVALALCAIVALVMWL